MTDNAPSAVAKSLIGCSSALGVVAVATTCLRIATRYSRRALGWDDGLIIAAMLATIVRFSINVYAVTLGYGQHQEQMTGLEYQRVNFLSWLGQIFLFLSLCLLKISIGLLIMRIKDSRASRIFQWTIIGGLILTNLEVLIVLLAECRPISAYWDAQAGECWPNKYRIYSIYIQVGYGILTDLIYSLMPAVIVWKLQMELKKKLLICSLMCMGLIATVCAALRARSLGLRTTDLSWNYALAALWGNIELGMGIIAANLVLSRSYVSFIRGRKDLSRSNHSMDETSRNRFGSRIQGGPSMELTSKRVREGDTESQRTLTNPEWRRGSNAVEVPWKMGSVG